MRSVGRLFIFAASIAVLAGVGLFLIGTAIITGPLLRRSPHVRKMQALAALSSAAASALAAFEKRT